MVTLSPPTDNKTILKGIRWQTYQALIHDTEQQPGKRFTFFHGTLEIMIPLPIHEIYKKLIDRLIVVTIEELNLEIRSLGSTTLSREDLAQGLEPDECYYIQNEVAIRGKTDINLNSDPPPDLAIEIDITSSSLNRLSIYAALGVPEIWRYDGKNLTIYQLNQGEYQTQENSQVLPILNRTDILSFLAQYQNLGETGLMRTFRQWLKQQILNPPT